MKAAFARVVLGALMALAAASAHAQSWGDVAIISSTLGNNTNRLCLGAPASMRPGDFGCPTYAPYVTSGGLIGIGTTTPSVALEVSGTISATNFVGNGAGLTGVTAGATDRIISGTNAATSMIAISNTGYISITQGVVATNTGWFDPIYGYVGLGVSTTGAISGTKGFFSNNLAGTPVLATLQAYGSVRFGTSPSPTATIGQESIAWGIYSAATGGRSTAWGSNTLASGSRATAWGYMATASGGDATAWGSTTLASGNRSTALGYTSIASGSDSIAWGSSTVASGLQSTAWGNSTQATLNDATAWGSNTIASGLRATAFGTSNTAAGNDTLASGNNTTASGVQSAAFGAGSIATGSQAVAFGNGTSALGVRAAALGFATTASGTQSFVLGNGNWAGGDNSFAMGLSNTAFSYAEFVLGRYAENYIPNTVSSWSSSDRIFVVGNGTGDSTRSNALTLLKNGKLGLGTSAPSSTLQVNGTVLTTSWTGINFSSVSNVTPAAPLEVSGTISATNFVGNGAGLTGITASAGGVSGSIQFKNQSGALAGRSDIVVDSAGQVGIANGNPSATLDVSGSVKIADGGQPCDAQHGGMIRYNAAAQSFQMCRP